MTKFSMIAWTSLVLSACSTLPTDRELRSVTLARRYAFAVCTGICPSYDLTATPNGWVEVQQLLGLDGHYRFWVGRSATAAAIAKAAQFRSTGTRRMRGCAVPVGVDLEMFDPSIVQYAIEWHGPSGTTREVACREDKAAVAVFDRALAALGVDLTGHPFNKQRLDGTRYGQRVSCDLGGGTWSEPRFDCYDCPPEAMKSSAKFYAVDVTHCRVEEPQ